MLIMFLEQKSVISVDSNNVSLKRAIGHIQVNNSSV